MPDLSSLGAGSVGIWTRKQALALLTAGEIDTLVRGGAWQVLWRGVYADGGVVVSAEQRAVAAVLAAGGAVQPGGHVASGTGRHRLRAVAWGRTAARFWRFPLIDDQDPATGGREHLLDHVAVERRLPRQSYDARVLIPHQVAFVASDLVRTRGGLWLSTALRTIVDCAGLLTHEALVCAMDFALHHELVALDDLATAAEARAGRPGGPALRAAVQVADGRSESPNETLARLLLLPVLPDLEPQVQLFDDAGRLRARFDLGDREVRLAVEADGKRGHVGVQMVAKDRARDRWTDAQGWTTERVTWFELRRQQADVVRRMVARHAQLTSRRPAA
jgi:hypothetical protein